MKSRIAIGLLLAACLLASAPPASAQCAMCANAAAAQQSEARKALNLGIATLVAPVFLLIGGFVVLAYKRRNPPDDSSSGAVGIEEFKAPRAAVANLPLSTTSDRPRTSL